MDYSTLDKAYENCEQSEGYRDGKFENFNIIWMLCNCSKNKYIEGGIDLVIFIHFQRIGHNF